MGEDGKVEEEEEAKEGSRRRRKNEQINDKGGEGGVLSKSLTTWKWVQFPVLCGIPTVKF